MDDELLEESQDQQQQQQAAGKDGAGKSAESERIAQLEAELNRTRTSLQETEENVRFWHSQAKATPQRESATAKEAAPAKIEGDLVDAISSNDPVKIKAIFRQMGIVDKEEVARIVEQTKNEVLASERNTRAEAEILAEFPDLKNRNSDFFKATSKHYQAMLADDPNLKNSPATMKHAARLAKAEIGASETEEERAKRADRQGGSRGTARRTSSESEDLDAASRDVMNRFKAAGATINEDSYKKRVNATKARAKG